MTEKRMNKMKSENDKEEKKEKGFVGKYWTYVILFIFAILFIYQNYYFISQNSAPPYGDAQFHLMSARREYRFIFEGGRESPLFNSAHPPLVYLNTVIFFALFRPSIKTALWSLLPFAAIFVGSVYGIGSHFGGREGGLAAALIAMSCHYFMQMTHRYLLDMPQAALTVLAIYFLLKSKYFSNFLYSCLFGVAMALAMLTKWTGLFYLAPAIIVILGYLSYKSWKTALIALIPIVSLVIAVYTYYRSGIFSHIHEKPIEKLLTLKLIIFYLLPFIILLGVAFFLRKKLDRLLNMEIIERGKALLNGVTAILIAAVIDIPFYIYAQRPIVAKILNQKLDMIRHSGEVTGSVFISNLKFYMSARWLVLFLFLLFALTGVIFALVKRENLPELSLLALMALSGIMLTSLASTPSVPYIITLLAFIAVFAGYWVKYTGWVKIPILGLIFIYSFLSFAYILPIGMRIHKIGQFEFGGPGFSFIDGLVPDTRNYFMKELVLDLAEREKKIVLEGPPRRIPIAVEFSPDFCKAPHKSGLSALDDNVFGCYAWYYGRGYRLHYLLNNDWRRRPGELSDVPFFLIVGYMEENSLQEADRYAREKLGRELHKISEFKLDDGRKILLMESPLKN